MLEKPRNIYTILIAQLGIVWFFMTLFRIVFLFSNPSFFSDFSFLDYAVGAWFDLITISFFYLPFIFFSIAPFGSTFERFQRFIKLVLYVPVTFIIFFLNAWDVAFFSFTRKRVSFHYFKFLFSENEAGILAIEFITEFWWLILFFVFSLSLVFYLFFKFKTQKSNLSKVYSWSLCIVILFSAVIIGRGGFQLKPVDIIEVSKYTSLKNAPAALNSAFTMLKTIDYKDLDKKEFFTDQEADAIFNPLQRSVPAGILKDETNVVLIIFESFGSMYVGPNNEESYTPFLDSILNKSMYFEHGVSNGQSSMDAVPAILASIPSWMKETFILSSYSMNQYNSLPGILKDNGYSSSFFHGPTNGSMRFDSFTLAAGFDKYYGRTEYDNEDHFDGTWGIPDHYFLPWTVGIMNGMRKPFFSTVFTYSSHHPYTIPEDFQDITKSGPDPLCKSISYADYGFRDFWLKARKQEWFNNTLFVFCADHVGPTSRKDRGDLDWSFKIPIAFYHESGVLPNVQADETMQQIDLMPTVLDLLNIETDYFSVGSSYLSGLDMPNMSYYQNNIVSLAPGRGPIIWNEIKDDPNSDKAINRKIKAVYQQYINALVNNEMLP
jgi:phosphoglycerol transferase MdoB-like AlkP superfamily enzyme